MKIMMFVYFRTHYPNFILGPKSLKYPMGYFEFLSIFQYIIHGLFIVLSIHEVSWVPTLSDLKQECTEISYRKKSLIYLWCASTPNSTLATTPASTTTLSTTTPINEDVLHYQTEPLEKKTTTDTDTDTDTDTHTHTHTHTRRTHS